MNNLNNNQQIYSVRSLSLASIGTLLYMLVYIYLAQILLSTMELFKGSSNQVAYSITDTAITQFIILLLFILYDRIRPSVNFVEANNRVTKWYWFILIVLVGYVTIFLSDTFLSSIKTENQEVFESLLDETPLWQSIVSAAIIVPLVEEYLFRKTILGKLFKGSYLGLFVSSLLFALVHVTGFDVVEGTPYFVSALIFGLIYKFSGNFYLPVTIHMLNNLSSMIL